MKTRLSINENCELVVSPYHDKCKEILDDTLNPGDTVVHNNYYIEFVVSPNIDSNKTLRILNTRDYYTCPIPKDGLYVYYIIEVLTEADVPEDYKDLYYDSDKCELMFNNKPLKNIIDIVPYLQVGSGAVAYKEIPIFSLCKLRKCIIRLQQESLNDCHSKKCNKDNDTRRTKDFLFISLYVLENLVCQERYLEASNILESLTSCNSICEDSTYKTRNCGCNG